MSNEGYIYLHRKLRDNPVYKNSTALHCWIHCLLKATFKDREFYWKREKIKLLPGQFITGRDKFGAEIGIPPTTAWFWIRRFEVDGMLDTERTPKGTLVTIKNWEEYQSVDSKVDNGWTTDGQRMDTYNNDNNDNNEKKERERGKKSSKKKAFGTLASLTDDVVREVAVHYNVSVSYVLGKREALYLHCESKGATYKNYKAALMNFVRNDLEKSRTKEGEVKHI